MAIAHVRYTHLLTYLLLTHLNIIALSLGGSVAYAYRLGPKVPGAVLHSLVRERSVNTVVTITIALLPCRNFLKTLLRPLC